MSDRPLILLLDGNALVHRAYHAIRPLTSPSGEPTNATFGFTSTLLKVLNEFKAQYIAVAFDVGRTFRHDMFPEYKANRPAMPDDLRVQLDRVRELVATFDLPAEYLETAIRERYGLEPNQLLDFKTLQGDSSDNIPGVPGVGKVTASKLLQEFGTIENLYQHLDDVRPKLQSNLKAKEKNVQLGRKLIQLVDDLPIDLDLDQCRFEAFDRDKVLVLFRELGFHRLMQRLPGAAQGPTSQLPLFAAQQKPATPPPTLGKYDLVNSETALRKVVTQIRAAGVLCVDTETTSTRPMEADLVGIALSHKEGEGYYIPVGHVPEAASAPQLSLDVVRRHLGPILMNEGIAKYAHNANYDLIVLHQHGMDVRGLAFDTMLAAYLLDPTGRNLGLKGLVWQILDVEMTHIHVLIGKGKQQITMDRVAVDRVLPYAAADADMTLRLAARLEPQLREKQLWDLFTQVEMPLVPVLMDMECAGIGLDTELLKQMSTRLATDLGELQQQIQQHVGYPLNLNSSQQLSKALFDTLGLPTDGVSRGKSGRYSTAAGVLENLPGEHPVIDLILEHRQLSKIKSTYVDALPAMVNPRTGRVHTSWNQTGTVTGRLSSSEPNLQNIPIRTEVGRRVRQAFVARPGNILLAADYSQVELRILAHLSRDENLLSAFHRGEDIHVSTAARILEVPLEKVTPDMRRLAKTINFGLIYGMGGWGLANRTELTLEEAGQFISSYFAQYPRVREYLDGIKQQAQDQGWVETLLGRKRHFPELQSGGAGRGNFKAAALRMAINHPIQGTAADIIKIAMIRLHDELQSRDLSSKMILQVHDELVLEVPDSEAEPVTQLVRSVMESAYTLDVPLKVDVKTGSHWGEMR